MNVKSRNNTTFRLGLVSAVLIAIPVVGSRVQDTSFPRGRP